MGEIFGIGLVISPGLSRQGNVWATKMLSNRAEIQAERAPVIRGKSRLLTLEAMDGRTVAPEPKAFVRRPHDDGGASEP
jgi:hypothetical protein